MSDFLHENKKKTTPVDIGRDEIELFAKLYVSIMEICDCSVKVRLIPLYRLLWLLLFLPSIVFAFFSLCVISTCDLTTPSLYR